MLLIQVIMVAILKDIYSNLLKALEIGNGSIRLTMNYLVLNKAK